MTNMRYAHHDSILGYQIGATSSATSFGILFSPVGVTVSSGVYSFDTNWSGASELSNLYDLMKIDKVEITLYTNLTGSSTSYIPGTQINMSNPVFQICNDDNDVTAVTDLNQQQGVKLITFNDKNVCRHICYPKYQSEAYKTATTVGFAPKTGFVNSSEDVKHFGTKMSLQWPADVSPHYLYMKFKLFCTVKNVK